MARIGRMNHFAQVDRTFTSALQRQPVDPGGKRVCFERDRLIPNIVGSIQFHGCRPV